MELKKVLLFFTLSFSIFAFSQVKVGNNPNDINPSSIMELESNDKALVLTRLTSAQMQSINPLNGALAYNTDTSCVHYYNGNQWINLCNSSNATGFSFVDNGDGTITLSDGSGNDLTFNGAPETTTTLTDNLDGTYTFTNEVGTQTVINTSSTDSQTLSTDGNPGNISILNGNAINLNVDDTDADDQNEIQDLQYNLGVISLTNDPDVTLIDLSSFDSNEADDFSGSFNDLTDVPANLDTDSTDDFSGSFNDLTDVPANLDTDSTDDFDGEWSSLNNVPAGFADDIDNDTQLTDAQVATAVNNEFPNLDTDVTDDFSGDFGDLTNVPVNLDTDSTDDFSGSFNDLTDVPANLDTDSTDDF
ncbi:hypothetical protein, partial [Flagellimonas flava]